MVPGLSPRGRMTRVSVAAALLSTLVGAAAPQPSREFLKYWKSGLAELSSYDILAERYGEMRKAQGVMVFVYEETNSETRIKVETGKTPEARRIPTLKLNNILKFNTGIYDYSVMTSVFAGLSGSVVKRPFQPLKISFSSQEWCGNVYHHLLPMPSGLVSELHSYFEAEGDSRTTLSYPQGELYYEDELPILVRELDGIFMEPGTSRTINLMPSLWGRRKQHAPLAISSGTLTKAGPDTLRLSGVNRASMKWTLEQGGVTTTYHVESAPPRTLLAWENSRGETGRLIKSLRKTYWKRNGNKDEPLRKELGIRYGLD